jgi:hypothetical protein
MKNYILLSILSLFLTFSYAQKRIYYTEYNNDNQKEGSYNIRSLSEEYLERDLPIIKSNIETLDSNKYPEFLNPYNKEIVLFENHDLSELKPIGKLIELTQIRVDSIIHKYKFEDLTNCVWNRIFINDKHYYTDADIHDFTISRDLNKFNQKIKIIGQFDGYDGAYHLGYPEYFFVIFSDYDNNVIYRTDVFDFHLNNEFAMEEDILRLKWNETSSAYEITLIGAEEKISINWDEKKLSEITVGNKVLWLKTSKNSLISH